MVKQNNDRMRFSAGAAWWLLACGSVAGLALAASGRAEDVRAVEGGISLRGDTATEPTDSAQAERIELLIEQLGHPKYVVRRQAQIELQHIGAAAFDQLHAATRHPDPETAASANYLLHEMAVPWSTHDDPPLVRKLMQDYGDRSESERVRRIAVLAQKRDPRHVAALCRIVRYDLSPLVSRLAASIVIQPTSSETPSSPADAQLIVRQLGGSPRVAAGWLRIYALQTTEPRQAAEAWREVLEQEARLLRRGGKETNSEVDLGLLWNYLYLNTALGDRDEVLDTADRMLSLDPEQFVSTATGLLDWIVERDSWNYLDNLLAKYEDEIARTKRTQYAAACARASQGKQELADELAAKALAIVPGRPGEAVLEAYWLVERSQYDWAKREYRQAIDGQPAVSPESLVARKWLSDLQYDLGEYRDAADTLAALEEVFQGDGKARQRYNRLQRQAGADRRDASDDLRALAARRHFYLACHYQQERDFAKQREHLEEAIRREETDADVLIAMYRLQDADAEWMKDVRKRVKDLAEALQREIDENPDESVGYNQWAWLISNTEGDHDRAVRYSHKSLELSPDTAEYLDTLGRCYYARGDYANAVKYQQRAVELQPYVQIMQRQLALFEAALSAKRQTDAP